MPIAKCVERTVLAVCMLSTAPATGNVKMKRVCFRTKRVCFSSANVGMDFSLSLETRRVTVSQCLVLYTHG